MSSLQLPLSILEGIGLVILWSIRASTFLPFRISLCYGCLWVDENDSSFTPKYRHVSTRVCI